MHYGNKFLQDYAKPGQHGSPKDEKDKKNKVRQYNNPKNAKLQSERKKYNV
jgi:hypothetical protein